MVSLKKRLYIKTINSIQGSKRNKILAFTFLREAKYVTQEELSVILDNCEEILKILGKIQKTSKKKSRV